MQRRLSCLIALAAFLLVAGSARAQDAGVAASWASSDFALVVQAPAGNALSDFEVQRFFNKARCDCDEEAFVYVALTAAGLAKKASNAPRGGSIEVWVGSQCDNILTGRQQRCTQLYSNLFASFLANPEVTIPVSVRVLSTDPLELRDDGTTPSVFTPNPTCTLKKEKHSQNIYVLLDTNNDGTPDTPFTTTVEIDLTAPPRPVIPPDPNGVMGGNQAVIINWEGVDISIYQDVIGYQVLCNRAGELQVFNDGTFDSAIQTCPATRGMGVEGLDPRFVCSPLLSPSTRSYRVKILQDGINYGVGVVAIDKSGNALTPEVLFGKPTKTKSFYDVYRDCYNGTTDNQCIEGEASGGMCALAPEQSVTRTAGWLAGAAALAIAGLVLRRRRRR
jgi:hypothetical protein